MLPSDPAVMEDQKYCKNARKHTQQSWHPQKARGDDHHVAHSRRPRKKCTHFEKRQNL